MKILTVRGFTPQCCQALCQDRVSSYPVTPIFGPGPICCLTACVFTPQCCQALCLQDRVSSYHAAPMFGHRPDLLSDSLCIYSTMLSTSLFAKTELVLTTLHQYLAMDPIRCLTACVFTHNT